MSNIAKNIFSSTDKFNFLSNTKNITKLLSKYERFSNDDHSKTEEEHLRHICKIIVGIRILYVLIIFGVLLMATFSENSIVTTELFMGLSLLTLLMPDVVVIIMIIIFIIGKVDNTPVPAVEANQTQLYLNGQSVGSTDANQTQLYLNGQSVGSTDANKFILTQTPDIFN